MNKDFKGTHICRASHLLKIGLLSAVACLLAVVPAELYGQGQTNDSGIFIDDAKGRQDWRVDFNVTGNNVESIITNWGTVGNGNGSINQAGVWPKGTGHGHLHEMTGMAASRVRDVNGDLVTIVSDGYGASSNQSEIDPETNIRWKFQPIPGYLNRNIEDPEIANSRNPSSWPDTWPDRPSEWDGQWNGYFGLNQFNADQEVFYVMDDLSHTKFEYYPIDGDLESGGMGLQIRVRIFQWDQALARDILFMQYEVSNIGDQQYTTSMDNNPIFFGGYTDVNPAGAGTTDDAAAFTLEDDLVYGWASTGQGSWSQFRDIPPGYIGWKFLQSPGLDFDLIDNDDDGIIDESQDNPAGEFVFGPCGIYDEPQERWSGDENCDWNPLTDDVGSDGIGPGEPGYPGPDPDGTEGNGRPDQGEPNFGRLDNAEADQVGLTSFYGPLFGAVDIHNEETIWPNLQPGFFAVPAQGVNQVWIFGSGTFRLFPNTSQRFGTAFVFGANERAMFRSSAVAQRIYDSDYRFATPPRQPEVRAIPGDGRVTLVWDNLAEFSRDPIYGFDFEGYRVIKSTDPRFRDAEDITDSFGNAVYKRSIAQFDLVNGLEGYHSLQFGEEIGIPNGVHYYMGDDTGLQHYYIDENVTNGRNYYYAVVSYDAGYDETYFDRGISDIENLFPISPSESPASITLSGGVITNFDRNTVQVRPNPPASDKVEGEISVDSQNRVPQTTGRSTGAVRAFAVDRDLLPDDSYEVSFEQERTGLSVEYRTTTYSITTGSGRTIVDREPIPENREGEQRTSWTREILDEGLTFTFQNQYPSESNTQQNSGWQSGSATNLRSSVTQPQPTFSVPDPPLWPIRVVLEVGQEGQELGRAFTSRTGNTTFPVNFRIYEKDTGNPVDFIFTENDTTRNGSIDAGELIQLIFKNEPGDANFTVGWEIRFQPPVDGANNPLPPSQIRKPALGDTYELNAQIPFSQEDSYSIQSSSAFVDESLTDSVLDKIIVVPNPYVAANVTEERPFLSGRGERRIEFRNMPANARLRIYSQSGVFIRELQSNDGLVVWDLQSRAGLEVAYGMYFYHVRADGIGEKTGKFAIIN